MKKITIDFLQIFIIILIVVGVINYLDFGYINFLEIWSNWKHILFFSFLFYIPFLLYGRFKNKYSETEMDPIQKQYISIPYNKAGRYKVLGHIIFNYIFFGIFFMNLLEIHLLNIYSILIYMLILVIYYVVNFRPFLYFLDTKTNKYIKTSKYLMRNFLLSLYLFIPVIISFYIVNGLVILDIGVPIFMILFWAITTIPMIINLSKYYGDKQNIIDKILNIKIIEKK